MRRIILTVCLMVAAGLTQAQGAMSALFGYSTFYAAGTHMPYVETYISFDAWTMQFVEQPSGAYMATVEVVLVTRQGDSVCYAKKYDLKSPTVGSLDELDFNFIDLQRFSLRNGIYDLEVSLRDKNAGDESVVVSEKLVVAYDDVHPAMSSVQMMSALAPTHEENIFSRGGYDMEPYVSDFIPEQMDKINFYCEAYNIDKEIGRKPFLAMAYIEQRETGSRYEASRYMARKYSAAVVPLFGSIDISELPSGNYNLVVELRNSDNQLMLYSRLPFFRSNPGVEAKEMSDFAVTFVGVYTDESQLDTYLDALYPIASSYERSVVSDLLRRPALEEKQAFLFRFWRDRYPMTAEAEWLKYKERVDYVQSVFSYPRTKGIHTDRGRVYLQYGPPDFVRDEKNYVSTQNLNAAHHGADPEMRLTGKRDDDPYASPSHGHIYYLPYQLWRYNNIPGDDPERVFLFWDEHRSGYYTLLNSNARGEVQEAGWERRLSRQQLPEGEEGDVGKQFNRGY